MSPHTVFCAECTTYFDWKSLGVFYTHRVSGMPGKITRLLACSDAQLAVYPERGMKMGPTFVHKNYIDDPTRCDPVSKYCDPSSGSYNKPAAVMHWSQEAQIAEEYVLYVDADMLLRAPLDPIELGAKRGRVVSRDPYPARSRSCPVGVWDDEKSITNERSARTFRSFANFDVGASAQPQL